MSSRVESFGMTAGEAMANGAICISTDSPSLPEIFNNAAIYYDPGNSEDISSKIQYVLSLSLQERKRLSKIAVLRSKQFSWEICAEKIIDCFSEAINSRNGF